MFLRAFEFVQSSRKMRFRKRQIHDRQKHKLRASKWDQMDRYMIFLLQTLY